MLFRSTNDSHIIGYAEMLSRPVGTGALDFLGFSMSSGGDVGAISLVRRTGTAGTNNFNLHILGWLKSHAFRREL